MKSIEIFEILKSGKKLNFESEEQFELRKKKAKKITKKLIDKIIKMVNK